MLTEARIRAALTCRADDVEAVRRRRGRSSCRWSLRCALGILVPQKASELNYERGRWVRKVSDAPLVRNSGEKEGETGDARRAHTEADTRTRVVSKDRARLLG